MPTQVREAQGSPVGNKHSAFASVCSFIPTPGSWSPALLVFMGTEKVNKEQEEARNSCLVQRQVKVYPEKKQTESLRAINVLMKGWDNRVCIAELVTRDSWFRSDFASDSQSSIRLLHFSLQSGFDLTVDPDAVTFTHVE